MKFDDSSTKKPSRKKLKRVVKIGYLVLLHALAVFALFMISVALASKFKLTNTSGDVDVNNRYFSKMAGKYNQGFKIDSTKIAEKENEIIRKLGVLAKKYPYDAKKILDVYTETKNYAIASGMLDAVNLILIKDKSYQKEMQEVENAKQDNALSAFSFSNYAEWKDFTRLIQNDKKAIDSVAKITGVEARLIVMCVVGEQIRMFNSERERFKQQVYKYNRIILPVNRGYGISGILKNTALRIEKTLFKLNDPFFPGEYFKQCINFSDSLSPFMNDSIEDHKFPTIQRLIRGGDHFYSYLYTALLLRQYFAQWQRQGYSLAHRPEILGTLFNLGYQKSKPSNNPKVGGSDFIVGEKKYTFGGLCYEFYYSGELFQLFPITPEPFTPTEVLEKTIVFPKIIEKDEPNLGSE